MLTNQDIDECIVMAELEINEDIEAALEDYYRPDVEREAAILWAGLPDGLKKLVKQKAPDAVRNVVNG